MKNGKFVALTKYWFIVVSAGTIMIAYDTFGYSMTSRALRLPGTI